MVADAEWGAASPFWGQYEAARDAASGADTLGQNYGITISGGSDIRFTDCTAEDALDAVTYALEGYRGVISINEARSLMGLPSYDGFLAVLDGIKPASSLVHDLDCAQRPSWHKRRCSRCSPLAFATPPNPAARDYHRRQKARKRRSR
jgi:hypothetical protein